jgi:hypothetical protein
LPAEAIGSFADTPEMKITFVVPDKEPVDITPPASTASPYEGATPDLNRPALSKPTSRTVNPGHGLGPWKTDRDPNGWIK